MFSTIILSRKLDELMKKKNKKPKNLKKNKHETIGKNKQVKLSR